MYLHQANVEIELLVDELSVTIPVGGFVDK